MVIRFTQRITPSLFFTLFLAGMCGGQTTERVSVNSIGTEGNGTSYEPSVSADGRYVAFYSLSTNFVQGDANGIWDVFVHDRQTGVTELVSVDSNGTQGNDWSDCPSISADGRYVAFPSLSTNLVPGDTNDEKDIFVHDRLTGVTERVSLDSLGGQGDDWSDFPSISADGRHVAFTSRANNLVAGDTNWDDIFIHDRQTGVTERVSVGPFGTQGNGSSIEQAISADGRYVAFSSGSSNLVPGDTNMDQDIFVHDRQTGMTERVSVDSMGTEGDLTSFSPSISADGRHVAFESRASNLVPWDTNVDYDVFVHDRQTGVTERVSVNSRGTEGNSTSDSASISADGRHVAFSSKATSLVPGDSNAEYDIFVHDRQTGVTERASVNSLGAQGSRNSRKPSISADGSYVAFDSRATNLVPVDTNVEYDIFVHDRWNGLGVNSIFLPAPSTSPVFAPLGLTWQTTRGGSQYWLACSPNVNGTVMAGHRFNLGAPISVVATGIHTTNGLGSFTSPPVPPGFAGQTLFFEVAAVDAGGILYDSNVLGVSFY